MSQPTDPSSAQPPPVPPAAPVVPPVGPQVAAASHPPERAPIVNVVSAAPGFGRVFGASLTAVGTMAGVFMLGAGACLLLVLIIGVWAGSTAMDEVVQWGTYRQGRGKTIAILPITGVIDGRQAGFVRRAADRILDSKSVAVVLRVDSPGGGITASDQIWNQVERLKKSGLPVIASFGGVAASGGYYVSCASDTIVAERTCITGSIGVIAQIMTMEGLMDKVGVEPVTLVARRSPQKSIANDTFREWTDADREQVLHILDAAYETFHTCVQQGRAAVITDEDALSMIADGSVFTADEALDRGLIDQIGYLDDAIAVAEQKAGIATGSASVAILQDRRSWLSGLGGPLGMWREAAQTPSLLNADSIRGLVNELRRVRIMYLMHAP